MIMENPKYKNGDTVIYNGRQGRITALFKEKTHPTTTWRYYVLLRNGTWSVSEDSIEKLVKKAEDGEAA
jgi:hypothetical protein